jgi:hypothetical protein
MFFVLHEIRNDLLISSLNYFRARISLRESQSSKKFPFFFPRGLIDEEADSDLLTLKFMI